MVKSWISTSIESIIHRLLMLPNLKLPNHSLQLQPAVPRNNTSWLDHGAYQYFYWMAYKKNPLSFIHEIIPFYLHVWKYPLSSQCSRDCLHLRLWNKCKQWCWAARFTEWLKSKWTSGGYFVQPQSHFFKEGISLSLTPAFPCSCFPVDL